MHVFVHMDMHMHLYVCMSICIHIYTYFLTLHTERAKKQRPYQSNHKHTYSQNLAFNTIPTKGKETMQYFMEICGAKHLKININLSAQRLAISIRLRVQRYNVLFTNHPQARFSIVQDESGIYC